jgi:hypothetical protein
MVWIRTFLLFALIMGVVEKLHQYPRQQFFQLSFFPQRASIKLTSFRIRSNKDIVNVTCTYRNDDSGIKLNLTLEIFRVLEKLRADLKVRLQMDESDQNYKNEFFQTSIDAENMFKNIHGNFMIKMVTEPFFKNLDVQHFEFPIAKVRRNQACQVKTQVCSHLQGKYKSTNMAITDDFIPFTFKKKALIESRYVARVLGTNKSEHFYTWQAYVEIDRKMVG